MSRNKKLFLLTIVVINLLVSSLACGQSTEQTVAIANDVQGEVNQLDEECQLNALWMQTGEDNKMSFLHNIHDGCEDSGRLPEWEEAWEDTTDMSYEEYKSSK